MRKAIEYSSKKFGFPLSVINSLGAGICVYYTYMIVLEPHYKNECQYISIAMGFKTFFINVFICYQVFNKKQKNTKSVEHISKDPIDTASTYSFLCVAIASILLDTVTNFLSTYTQFRLLAQEMNSKRDYGKEAGVVFGIFAVIKSFLFSTSFALELLDRMRLSEPENRFKNYGISLMSKCKLCGSKPTDSVEPSEASSLLPGPS